MKKTFIYSLAAAVAAIAFSSCTKNEIASEDIQPAVGDFSIFAEITKTTNGGMSTNWAADDAINLFHAEAGATEYSANSKFTISEEGLATGKFTGTLSDELSASNDWYALYPYNSNVITPANPTKGYLGIGSSGKLAAQVQTGNSSTAHLAGQYFPLCAKASGIAKNSTVSLKFKPILSVVKIHVTNNTSKAITVSSASVTAPEVICGTYYIDFSGDDAKFTASGDDYVSKTANLTVKNGEEIAVGESADFYIAIKPFTKTAGDDLAFAVNGYSKTTTAAAEFAAGKIKTINFSYDKEEKDYSAENVAILALNDKTYYAMSGEPGTSTFMPEAEVIYDGSAENVTVTGNDLVWNIVKTSDGYALQNKSNSKYLYYKNDNKNTAYVTETLASGCYMTIQEDGQGVNIIEKVSSRCLRNNHSATRFSFYASDTGVKTLLFVKANVSSAPVLNPISSPSKVSSDGASGVSVSYTVINPVSGRVASASTTASWISNIDCSTLGTITFDVAKNTGSERSAEVTVSYEGAASTQTFTVSQSAGGEYLWTLEKGQLSTSAGTHTADGITWSYTESTYIGFDSTKGAQIGSKNNPEPNFTISTEGFTKKITSITVNATANGAGTIAISVGGTSYLSATGLTSSSKDYEGTGNASGKIEITLSATSKAMYLKSIKVKTAD